MKSLPILLTCFVLHLCLPLFCQSDYSIALDKDQLSANQITSLANGTLVVRLRSETKTMQAYLDKGLPEEAEVFQNRLDEENAILMNAFKQSFDFCPILFMYKSDHEHIIAGETKGYFVNDLLAADTSIELAGDFFLFIEMSKVYAASLVSNPDYSSTLQNSNEDLDITPIKHDCLVIKDPDLIQLSRPFPFYITTPLRFKKIGASIKKLNLNLKRYYAAQSH